MSNSNVYEILFRQWASVAKLVVDGKRDPAKVSKSLQEIINETVGPYDRARLILGKDFIPAEEISQNRGVSYSNEQLVMFAGSLPVKDELMWLRNNDYMLVAGPPAQMSLLEIRDIKPGYFYTKTGGWYSGEKEKFSRDEKVLVAWLGLRKKPVPDSISRDWDNQNLLLTKAERTPNSAETAWGITTYKAVRDIYLLNSVYVRTSSVVSVGGRVYLGDFGPPGFGVNDCWDGLCDSSLGLASARIFNPSNP